MSADATRGRRAKDERRSGSVHALLATVQHIVDSPSRTENARRLLLPVLVSFVLVVAVVVAAAVLAAPAWALGAAGAAGAGALVSGRRRRVSRSAARRARL